MVLPGEGLKVMTLPGALNLLMSEKLSWEKLTPTRGPGGVLAMPGG
jgi:hypothetical protein